jgi:hypothetical protein
MTFGITTDMKKYWNMYSGKERFDQESFIARQKNHTGNHHRNKMINVPKSAYGMK